MKLLAFLALRATTVHRSPSRVHPRSVRRVTTVPMAQSMTLSILATKAISTIEHKVNPRLIVCLAHPGSTVMPLASQDPQGSVHLGISVSGQHIHKHPKTLTAIHQETVSVLLTPLVESVSQGTIARKGPTSRYHALVGIIVLVKEMRMSQLSVMPGTTAGVVQVLLPLKT